jgi:hypothetical protein
MIHLAFRLGVNVMKKMLLALVIVVLMATTAQSNANFLKTMHDHLTDPKKNYTKIIEFVHGFETLTDCETYKEKAIREYVQTVNESAQLYTTYSPVPETETTIDVTPFFVVRRIVFPNGYTDESKMTFDCTIDH